MRREAKIAIRKQQHPTQKQQKQQPPSESWEDFHQQYCSDEFRNSANNPNILRRLGHVPSTFRASHNSPSARSLVDQLLLTRQDSASSLGCGSSNSGGGGSCRSDRGKMTRRTGGTNSFRRDESSASSRRGIGRRRSQGNIKIGQKVNRSRWTLTGLLFGK